MAGENGIKQSPFDGFVPTPGGSGQSGIGGGLDSDAGPNGIQQTPWSNPICPVPGMGATGGDADLPQAPDFTTLSDNIAPGTSFDPGQSGIEPKNTIDKR